MATRHAHVRWEDDPRNGQGEVNFGFGAFSAPYSFASRFGEDDGTSPEELLSAAHASCFAMTLARVLVEAGFEPEFLEVIAQVTIDALDEGFQITQGHLICEAGIPGIEDHAFAALAEQAKDESPMSRALAGVRITIESRLRTRYDSRSFPATRPHAFG